MSGHRISKVRIETVPQQAANPAIPVQPIKGQRVMENAG
jgi:hypothetical protein